LATDKLVEQVQRLEQELGRASAELETLAYAVSHDLSELFKRLHGRDEQGGRASGTGVGLALCRKIAERHGGRIGVEEGPGGQGARFCFTLPATVETGPP
jgi:light-regulated signal transduction histidine kinase (bacteriophytochrome)